MHDIYTIFTRYIHDVYTRYTHDIYTKIYTRYIHDYVEVRATVRVRVLRV